MVSVRGPKHRNHLLAVELINCPPASPEMGNTKGRNAVDDIWRFSSISFIRFITLYFGKWIVLIYLWKKQKIEQSLAWLCVEKGVSLVTRLLWEFNVTCTFATCTLKIRFLFLYTEANPPDAKKLSHAKKMATRHFCKSKNQEQHEARRNEPPGPAKPVSCIELGK